MTHINLIEELLSSFQEGKFTNEQLLNGLTFQTDNIIKMNDYEENNKHRLLKKLSLIDLDPNEKYISLYLALTKLPDLWCIVGRYKMTLLQYICYNGDPIFYTVLNELIKYPNIWKIQQTDHGNTSLHMLISTFKNYGEVSFISILKKLTQYPELWLVRNNYDTTPMHELCQYRDDVILDIIDDFASLPCMWENENIKSLTPLHYLCIHKPDDSNKNKYLDIFKKLSKHTLLWEIQDEFLCTPLHHFCKNFIGSVYDEIYDHLKKYSYLWEIQNKLGQVPGE